MTFSRYLAYRLKSSALRTIVFSLLSLVVVMYVVIDHNTPWQHENSSQHATGLYMLAVVIGAFATLIPMLETACFKSRRNLDTLYCLPIKRSKLALAHYLSGFIQVVFIYSVNFFTAYIYLGTVNAALDCYDLGWMMLYYLFSLLVGAMMYSIFIFLFSEANTILDGVVISVLWMFVIYVIFCAVELIISNLGIANKNDQALGIIYAPINNLTVIFQKLIETNRRWKIHRTSFELTMNFVSWGVFGITCALGYFYNMLKKGAEEVGEISDSWFGYKIIIPIYGYALLLLNGNLDVLALIIFCAMIIGYIIFRRQFKLKLPDYVMLVLSVLVLYIATEVL